MPSYQQGGRNGQRDFDRNVRNDQRTQGQRADQGYRDLGYRSEARGSRAGGRSEEYARQRDNEQLRAGYRREEWNRPNPTHNVRSEPHWDPNEWRGEQRSGQSYESYASSGWNQPRHDQPRNQGSWEEDRYYGSPSYEQQRGFKAQRGFGQRALFRSDEPERGYSQQGYNQLRGARNFEGSRAFGGQRSYEHRDFHRDERDQEQADLSRTHDEDSMGQQLQDAGRRLIGKVKRLVRNPKNYKRSDERIREDVCDRLALSDEVDPSEIEVTVSGGEVTLTGSVDSRHEKFIAEELADEVPGVHDVHNQLRLKRGEGQVANTNSTSGSASSQDVSQQKGRSFGRS